MAYKGTEHEFRRTDVAGSHQKYAQIHLELNVKHKTALRVLDICFLQSSFTSVALVSFRTTEKGSGAA